MEPIIGYRAWIFKDGHLYSPIINEYIWPYGKPLKAENYINEPAGAVTGIYAFKDKTSLKKEFGSQIYICNISESYILVPFDKETKTLPIEFIYPGITKYPLIRGEVYLWGKIVEHEFGYRAEFAYPKKLYKHKNLAQKYGCEF